MKILDVRQAPPAPNPHGVRVAKVYDDPSAVAMHITLEPGEALKPHKTPVDVFFYVLEGEPSVTVGKETVRVPADRLVESPATVPHYIANETGAVARILVVKAPRPTTETKLL